MKGARRKKRFIMCGNEWNWCDAVQAIGSILTPLLGLGIVNHWFERKLSEKIDREENMVLNKETNATGEDALNDFWRLVQKNIPRLEGKSIPTRRYWSVPYEKGIRLAYVVLEAKARVELYIDNGDEEWNLRLYGDLRNRKAAIEKSLSAILSSERVQTKWFPRPDSRAKGLGLEYSASGLNDPRHWDAIIEFYKKAAPALTKAVA